MYQSEELLELYPWLSIVPENYLNAVSRHMPKGVDEYQVESILGRAIKNAILAFVRRKKPCVMRSAVWKT